MVGNRYAGPCFRVYHGEGTQIGPPSLSWPTDRGASPKYYGLPARQLVHPFPLPQLSPKYAAIRINLASSSAVGGGAG